MREYYRLDFQDLEFWKLKEDPNTNEKYYERVKESGSFCLEEIAPTMINGMTCNYKDVTVYECIRIKNNDGLIIIEPSNIRIPENNMRKLSSTDEIIQTDPIIFRNISVDTFICNFISDFTRGGRNKISEEEVELLKEKFINESIVRNNNSTLSASDFMFMFSSFMFENEEKSFERSELMDYIFSNQDNPKYKSILENVKVYRNEHYDVSSDLEFGLASLKYAGILHPNYKEDNPYEYLSVDKRIMDFTSLYNKRKAQYPEMEEFLNDYVKSLDKKPLEPEQKKGKQKCLIRGISKNTYKV